jgi:dihydroorotate dehydrogenase electron transfer subunit
MQMLEEIRYNHKKRKLLLSTVSGVASTKPNLIRFFDSEVSAVGIITTKSFQLAPNPGNREPVITEPETGCFGNSVGLRNPGLDKALAEIRELRAGRKFRCLLNISVSASSIGDFAILVKSFEPYADSIELNFSCPHAAAGYGAAIGSSAEIAAEYVRGIRAACPDMRCPLFAKLTPNVPDIASIAKAVVEAGADGITAINTAGPDVYMVDGHVVLNNSLNGRGGRSGGWVRQIALEAITEIRKAIGDDLIIIGEGGVSTGEDAARMICCGADAVGIGSSVAMVNQILWPEYFAAVKSDGEAVLAGKANPDVSSSYLSTDNKMHYERHCIIDVLHHDDATVVLTLDGTMDSQAGQFAFIWIPEIGEKPFSVATNQPLRFIIKNRGPFTEKCMDLRKGDSIYVRGLYGKPVEIVNRKNAILLAGGTGEAVLGELAPKLRAEGISVSTYVGVTSHNGGVLKEFLSQFGSYHDVEDCGVPGRVLGSIVIEEPKDTAVYIVGPEIFMAKAAQMFHQMGVDDDCILISMEKNSMCGIGLCGECECHGRLTCQHGTFMNYRFLHGEGVI